MMKMNKHVKWLMQAVALCFFTVVACQPALADKKFAVAYLEAGPYWLFNGTMDAIRASLESRQWLDKISFPEDARFSPGWDQGDILAEKAALLMARDDLDLIIAAGTAAVRALLAANNQRTPIVAMAVSDPVGSGFIPSLDDSGTDNFTVRLDPDRFLRMFRMFHQVVEFRKLGLIFQDTESGRQYTNLEDARKVAAQSGFEIIEYDRLQSESTDECLAGIKHLVEQGMDAFFIPSLVAFDWEQSDVAKIFEYLRKMRIPTFARNGSQDVAAGALMGLSTVDFSGRGKFLSGMIISILEGASPRSLNMIDTTAPKISFNLAVADEISFNPPFDILAATDEMYQEITLPENRLFK